MNSIARLVTERNIALLKVISEQELPLREAAEKAECSPAKAHQAAQLFLGEGIAKVNRHKNMTLLSVNRENPVYQKLKALLNIYELANAPACRRLCALGSVG